MLVSCGQWHFIRYSWRFGIFGSDACSLWAFCRESDRVPVGCGMTPREAAWASDSKASTHPGSPLCDKTLNPFVRCERLTLFAKTFHLIDGLGIIRKREMKLRTRKRVSSFSTMMVLITSRLAVNNRHFPSVVSILCFSKAWLVDCEWFVEDVSQSTSIATAAIEAFQFITKEKLG